MRYKYYFLYGKEKNKNTGVHTISHHKTKLGAIVAYIIASRYFYKLYIA